MTSAVDLDFFMELGKSVLNVDDNFSGLKEKYEAHTISFDELYQYLVLVKAKGIDNQIQPVFDAYFIHAAK